MSGWNNSTFLGMESRHNGYNGSCLLLQQDDGTTESNNSVKSAEFWLAVIITSMLIAIITFVGIPGNILSALVFYRLGLGERINLCLFALAVQNLTHLAALLMTNAEFLYSNTVKPSWVITPYATCGVGAGWASQFLSAVIASERCFCVVSPFHAKRLLKTSTMAAIIVVCCVVLVGGMAAIIVVCCCVLIGGMCAIAGPKHGIVCVFHPDTEVTEDYLEYVTEYYLKNKQIIDFFDIIIYALMLPGIFLLVIIITTVITAVKMRAALAWRLTAARKTTTEVTGTTCARGAADDKLSKKDVSVTLMLMRSSVLMAACITANLTWQTCRLTVPGFNYEGSYAVLVPVFWRFVQFFWTLNSSIPFFVYYNTGSKFREMVRNVLCSH